MKKRVMWLVIIILLISDMSLAFDITGDAVRVAGPCPCVAGDGVIVDTCYIGNNSNYASHYCSYEYNEITKEEICSLGSSCNICGCPSGKSCYLNNITSSYYCKDNPHLNCINANNINCLAGSWCNNIELCDVLTGCTAGTPFVCKNNQYTLNECNERTPHSIIENCDFPSVNSEFTLNLTSGWNYVSIPLDIIGDNNISQLGDKILTYDGVNDNWLVNYKDVLNQISIIEVTKGYIVWSDSDRSIVFSGTRNLNYEYSLSSGWNLVGVNWDSAKLETIYFGTGSYSVFEKEVSLENTNYLNAGKAYWVHPGIVYSPPIHGLLGFGNFFGYLFERSFKEIFG